MSSNEATQQVAISREEYIELEKGMEELKKDVEELKQWAATWNVIIKELAYVATSANRSNVRLVLKEVINPYAETTTVEQLLHLLESECPVLTVLDALQNKDLTEEESRRLVSDLENIIEAATKAVARMKQ